ncbi:MAG: type I restriction enzyme HsdR N-terminal domain-containing protein [Lachnospiraceae bacterium]|nr:type I restriction enzyme HsdR N-terminal domain-containing protein [Lachnospiraceae bacterium]
MNLHREFSKMCLNKREGEIYDPIREKWIKNTPEETVRQQMIQFMLKRMNVPKNRIGVEKALSTLGITGNRKRIDICIWDENNKIKGIIECKAYHISQDESPYQQVLDYVRALNAKYYLVTDGIDLKGFYYDESLSQFLKMENPLEDVKNL